MHTHYFAECLFLLFAALASIRVYSDLIILQQRSKVSSYPRFSSYSSGRRLGASSTMVFSTLHHVWNSVSFVGAAEESVAKAAMPPLHPNHNKELLSAVAKTERTIVEGVALPGHVEVDGVPLIRNGHGLRSITYFGIGIRIYLASMYSAKPILSADQAMGNTHEQRNDEDNIHSVIDASLTTTTPDAIGPDNSSQDINNNNNGPIQLDFTFLRYVRQSQVVSAWTQQLDHSVTYRDYEGYETDKDRFIQLASGGPIENHGTQSVQLVGDETRIIDQGTLTGVIPGRNFQRSFLSMWFGSMAVSEDLKNNLLRGDEHHPSKIQQVREDLEQELQQVLVEA